MNLLLTTCFGIEDVVEKELKEKDEKSKVIEKRKGRVIVEVSDLEKVFSMRSVHHVIKLLSIFNFNNLKEIKQKLSEIDFSAELRETEKFRITSERVSISKQHDFTSLDLQREAGEVIVTKYKKKVDLKNFDTEIRVDVIDDVCYVGIQLTKESLHKRGYRVFAHSAALKPSLAYAMLRIVDLKKKDTLLDPMCGGGTIAIEAAIAINPRKIFASDKNANYVKGAKKNAEKAGVLDKITFAVKDIKEMGWVGEVDKIVTNPPFGVRMGRGNAYIRKLYFDFLKSARNVVKDRICLLSLKSNIFKQVLKKINDFYIVHERTVGHGNIYPKLFILERR